MAGWQGGRVAGWQAGRLAGWQAGSEHRRRWTRVIADAGASACVLHRNQLSLLQRIHIVGTPAERRLVQPTAAAIGSCHRKETVRWQSILS